MAEDVITPRVRTVEADVVSVINPDLKYMGMYKCGDMWFTCGLSDTEEQAKESVINMAGDKHVVVCLDLREVMET